MTYTSPKTTEIFRTELEQTFNIEELEKEALSSEQEIRGRLEKLISSESYEATLFAEMIQLVAQAGNEQDSALRNKKLAQSEQLAWNLRLALEKKIEADASKVDLIELSELSQSYAYALSGLQKFFAAIEFMGLANEAKTRKELATELKYRTKAFEALTKIIDFWQYCSLDIRRTLHLSVYTLLVSEAFEEKTLLSEIKLRLQMLVPSLKNCSDILSKYRKAKKQYIQRVLIASECDNKLYPSNRKSQGKKSNIQSILKFAKSSSGWAGDDFEESLDIVNNYRRS